MLPALTLRQSIISTLAYFDLADFPLTAEEFFIFLWQPPVASREDFLAALAELNLPNQDDYYFLPGREKIVADRQRKFLISEQKLKIAKKAAKKIRSVPFLRAIFVCNSVGARQADEDSDIDFFIVTDPNRIWIVRFFTNLILRFFGLRTYGQKNKNKICLSFYVDTNHLDLASLRATESDIHFAYWVQQMLPIFDPDDYCSKFLQANQWTKMYLPNINLSSRASSQERRGISVQGNEIGLIGRIWKKIWEKMWQGSYGDVIEKQAKEIQLLKIKPAIKEKSKRNDNGVVISDSVLKFHENDARIKYKEDWERKIADIIK